MCGIAGIMTYKPGGADGTVGLRAASERLRARGPDGGAEWRSPDGRAQLAHRRLAIIDLSERATQPMASTSGVCVITYNGEIYNYRELRQELLDQGRQLRSSSDTEVLLHLYETLGEGMLQKLRGMFAFGLWDERRHELLLARDPYGIKPLYYTDDGARVAFASQVKALVAGGFAGGTIDPAAAVSFYLLGSVPEPWTTHREVRMLPAGSYLWVTERGAAQPIRYFSIAGAWREAAERERPLARPERQARVRDALRDSVRAHLVADVPVGLFLSSGIDSCALLGLMRDAGKAHVQAITVAFAEFRGDHADEAPLAARVAAHYGAAHALRSVSASELEQDLARIFDAMDQPSIDGINTWFVSKAAREHGLKVALSGLGGDELWGGYPSFRDLPRWTRLLRVPGRVPLLGRALRKLSAPAIARTRMSPKLASLIELGGSYPGAYLLRRGLLLPWELPAVLDHDTIEEGLERLDIVAHIRGCLEPEPGTDFGRVATLEASLYMRNQLLRDTDWASMAHALEVRTPLVDRLLLENVAPLVLHAPHGEGKRLLAASPGTALPVEVTDRRKTGFTTPIARWLMASPALDEWRRVPALARPSCHWSRRFAYVTLQRFKS